MFTAISSLFLTVYALSTAGHCNIEESMQADDKSWIKCLQNYNFKYFDATYILNKLMHLIVITQVTFNPEQQKIQIENIY